MSPATAICPRQAMGLLVEGKLDTAPSAITLPVDSVAVVSCSHMRQTRKTVGADKEVPLAQSSPVRSVVRAVDILMALTDGPQTLTAVCETANLSKATGHRLLASLAYRQLVLQDASTGRYVLGPGCFRFVDVLSRGLGGLGMLARDALERLRDESGETATLHIRVGGQRICVAELPSPHALRYTAGTGSTAPVHVGSAGKVLLAFLDEPERARILDGQLESITEFTITDREDLSCELDTIRTQGWAMSRGERVIGAAAVSVPVFDGESRPLAALSLLGPESRMTEDRMPSLCELALGAAQDISHRLAAGDEPEEEP